MEIVGQVEIRCASNHETSGTINTRELFGYIPEELAVGQRFILECEEVTEGILFYVNRKSLLSLYCSDLPKSIRTPKLKSKTRNHVFINVTAIVPAGSL